MDHYENLKIATDLGRLSLEKLARNALSRYMAAQQPTEQIKTLYKLDPAQRQRESYKLLADKARGLVDTTMRGGDASGHGPDHVYHVARNTQNYAGTRGDDMRPLNMTQEPNTPERASNQQHATIGALLHDIARPPEQDALARRAAEIGSKPAKAEYNANPALWHSEMGGHMTRQFLRGNSQLAQMAGIDPERMVKIVRSHNQDSHQALPWTADVVHSDPAAAAVFLGDKKDALGARGWDRTMQTGAKYKESPADTYNFAMGKNLPVYQNMVQTAPVTPEGREKLWAQLNEYRRLADEHAQRHGVPRVAAPWDAQTQPKAAMAVEDYSDVFDAFLHGHLSKHDLFDKVDDLGRGNNRANNEMFEAIFKIKDPHDRGKLLNALAH